MSGFLGVPVDAAYHLVLALTQLLSPVAGGLAAAAAIVLFTAAVRLLISPLSLRALRGQAAMARLAPQVQALRTRYRREPDRFQRELTALYKQEGTGPFSSLLPLLAQWPFLSVMYLLFRSASVAGGQNQLLSDGLFGVPLGAHWLSGAGLLSVHEALFLGVFAVLAAVCWLSARLAKRALPGSAAPAAGATAARREGRAPAAAARAGRPGGTVVQGREGARGNAAGHGGKGTRQGGNTARQGDNAAGHGGKGARPAASGTKARGDRPSTAVTRPDPAEVLANSKTAGVLTRVLPYVTVAIAAFAPLAAAIYLLTTVAWTLGERRLFLRRTTRAAGGLVAETR